MTKTRPRPTIKDVAKAAGVSTASVSRVLSGQPQSPTTVQKVHDAVTRLGYTPHFVAKSLVQRRTWLIGVIVPDISNPFFPKLIKVIQRRAEERGYGILLSQVFSASSAKLYLEHLESGRVDGIITIGVPTAPLSSSPDSYSEGRKPIPVVCLDRDAGIAHAPLVAVNHFDGAKKAVSHLIELGHRNIIHISGPRGLALSRERRSGYLDALAQLGPECPRPYIIPGDLSEESGFAAIETVLQDRIPFTAIFAANDLMAIGAISALRRHNISVPDSVSVIGFDDIDFAQYITPSLTTVHQPTDEMGSLALDLLLQVIESGLHADSYVKLGPEVPVSTQHKDGRAFYQFSGSIIVRNSTARPSRNSGPLGRFSSPKTPVSQKRIDSSKGRGAISL